MPKADFVCSDCLLKAEKNLKDDWPYLCPLCGNRMTRKWSAPAVIIK